MTQFITGRGIKVVPADAGADSERRERTHLENAWYDLLEPFRIVWDDFREDPIQFKQKLGRALGSAFNLFPKGPDGKKHFNGRAMIYWTGVGMVLNACAYGYNQVNHQPGETSGPDGNNHLTPESLCNSLLIIAAANSVDVAVTVPVWQAAAASADQTRLNEQLACYMPETTPKSGLVAGEVIPVGPEPGNEVVQLAWAGGGKVIPILAVPGAQVDDFQLVQFLDPWSGQWEALGSNQARTSLAAVNINAATGEIEPDNNGAVVTATRDSNGEFSFQITTPDGKTVVLSQDQVKHNTALARWLEQAAAIFEAETPEIPDIDLVGVVSPTPDKVGGGTPTPEFPPSPWLPPSLEQARVGQGGSFPADYGQTVGDLREIVLEQVPDAAEAGAAWNNGSGDDFRSVFWAWAGSGNYLWKTGEGQAFDEYPLRWNEYQSGIVTGQEFSEVPDSKDAVVGFTGPSAGGLGEKPVLMKEPVALADGSQGFLEYFDFQTGEWRLNASILQAMVPDGYTVSRDQSGSWLAASGDNQALLQFDLAKKVWVEVVTPESTMAAAIEAFGLNQEREYVVSEDGQYLVDTYNQAKMAKWVEGQWADTSLEEKYGHLAPADADYELIRHEATTGEVFYSVPVYWTGTLNKGEILLRETGQEIETTEIVLVTRDAGGNLIEVDSVLHGLYPTAASIRIQITETRDNGQIVTIGEIQFGMMSLETALKILESNGVALIGRRVEIAVFKIDRAAEIEKVKRRFPTCNLDDRSALELKACRTYLYLQALEDGEYDFGDDVWERLMMNTGDLSDPIRLFRREVKLYVDKNELGQETIDAIKKEAAELQNK